MSSTISTKIREGGRVVIPAEIRRELGLEVGDAVTLSVIDHEIRIISRAEALRRAQALVRKRIPKGRSLVAELHEERRREAVNE
jgi:AbrB family looped-hinge helix DNA binding protein